MFLRRGIAPDTKRATLQFVPNDAPRWSRINGGSPPAATYESGNGPTRTFQWTGGCVGCLRTSGLVLLAARLSESDPQPTSGRRLLRGARLRMNGGQFFSAD